jgi:hypothetical protein
MDTWGGGIFSSNMRSGIVITASSRLVASRSPQGFLAVIIFGHYPPFCATVYRAKIWGAGKSISRLWAAIQVQPEGH